MQLFVMPIENKKIPQILTKLFIYLFILLLLKKMQYGKTSYARQDQT
jgi:hypothetical protein